jgi:hypothetical protein
MSHSRSIRFQSLLSTVTTMSTTTPAALLDSFSAATIAADARPVEYPTELTADGPFRDVKASWHCASNVGERRREHRHPCNLPALLIPLDSQGLSVACVPLEVRIKDVSKHGIGISHPDPMPHRLVLLMFETPEKGQRRLVVRLKWCRFKRTDVYESGGQIVRALKPGESHASEPADTSGLQPDLGADMGRGFD